MTYPTIPDRVPAGATPEGDGVVVGPGAVRIDAFIDFLCPFCKRFELSSGPTLAGLVADGLASLVYHPMTFLDEASTTHYSTRAAASSGCAADYGRFLEYAHALFVNQPPEGGPGLTDAELAAIGRGVGLDPAFTACLSEGHYLDWPPYVTARAVAAGVSGTPTVLVDGVVVAPEAQVIAAAAAEVAKRLALAVARGVGHMVRYRPGNGHGRPVHGWHRGRGRIAGLLDGHPPRRWDPGAQSGQHRDTKTPRRGQLAVPRAQWRPTPVVRLRTGRTALPRWRSPRPRWTW